ncbi:glutamine amidotransferase [Propionispora sp. 2/2-37]|uniref:glutamine amidotransferase n=1 Tax=Propionispora sp. 2/2-37 TaxID=1677858 RepID=UPI0006BB7392|nr:glutamine amidotransferase [Propionispora sp. 2/2-37]
MRRLLIIKTGTTFASLCRQHGDFEDFIISQIGIPVKDVVVAPVYISKTIPSLRDVSAVIITGSHSMVTDRQEWSRELSNWLKNIRITSVPILGICYGHQIIADAWGGVVDYHPGGAEVGTVAIELTEAGKKDVLLRCLPERFSGHVAHAQTVITLPKNARLLAANSFEPHHAFVIHDNIWGVQFHPEFNEAVMRTYIEKERVILQQEGHDLERITYSLTDHTYGRRLLRRFITLAQ